MPSKEMPPEEYLKSSNSSISTGSLDNENLSLSGSSYNGDEGYGRRTPIFEPIILPKEATLDELLRNVASTNDLNTLRDVHLKVTSNMLGLQRLNVFLPSLVFLNLDGSELESLRNLGTNLTVKYLNISRCGLKTLDGTNGLSTVEHLIADGNHITNVQPLCNLSDLKILSLRENKIIELGTISFLVLCSDLKELDITNNPVTKLIEYREYVKSSIPNLLLLDGQPISYANDDSSVSQAISSSDYSPSISSFETAATSVSTTSNDMPEDLSMPKRPASCSEARNINEQPIRPATVELVNGTRSSSLSSGEPISGNIIWKARRERRKKIKTAWSANSDSQDSSSTTSLSSVSSSASTSAIKKIFPIILPQLNVELELGIVGLPSTQMTDNQELDSYADTDSLLAAARQWRQKTRKYE